MATTNPFSVLASFDPDCSGDSTIVTDVRTRVSRSRSVLCPPKGKSSEWILKEAIDLRDELLGLKGLSDYENIDVRHIAKSIEGEVIFLRKMEQIDSKRLAALEEQIKHFKRRSPVRMKLSLEDANGRGLVKITNPVAKNIVASQYADHVFDKSPKSVSEAEVKWMVQRKRIWNLEEKMLKLRMI
ncbi:hypothetical protein U1Q18_040636 [Sarracenia purpurea var. burkii]